ncbi:MAG: hypothetical protein AVDCRST_MAG58-1470, partial [uncultured Rubrobacteraceae bacterium]
WVARPPEPIARIPPPKRVPAKPGPARGSTSSSATRGRRPMLGAKPVPVKRRRERRMIAARTAHRA